MPHHGGMPTPVARATFPAPIGPVGVETTPVGVRRVRFGAVDPTGEPGTAEHAVLLTTGDRLAEYFAGRRTGFDLPIDWSMSSGWPAAVRRILYQQVGYGTTIGYGALAAAAGRPTGARAVGGIMAGNPIPIIVPCHRVVASDGGLGGFAGSRGAMVETKRRLLELEGAVPPTLF